MYYYDPKYIHAFEKKGKYFAYCTENLGVFELSEISYHILTSPNPIDPGKVKDLFLNDYTEVDINETFSELLDWGIISDKPVNMCSEMIVSNPFDTDDDKHYLNGLYLLLTHECNLKCKYCSAGYGSFGQDVTVPVMSETTAKRAIDFLFDNLRPNTKKLNIVFVGGEPLKNFNVLKSTVEYINSKTTVEIAFALNTNGTLMTNEIAEWFVKNNIDVRFSIDGIKEIHDKNRIFPNGKGSYDMTIKGLNKYKAVAQRGFIVQTSIPKGENTAQAVRAMWKLGASAVLANCTSESIYVDTKEFDMNKADYENYFNELDEINEEITENLIKNNSSQWIVNSEMTLKQLYSKEGRVPGCGMGRMVGVSPDGKVYLCQALVGFPEYEMGTIYEGIDRTKMKVIGNEFKKYMLKCKGCWALKACGTGCFAQSAQYNELGEEFQASRLCDLNKSRIESSAFMLNRMLEEKPSLVENMFHTK
jgi:uncharacterized protein